MTGTSPCTAPWWSPGMGSGHPAGRGLVATPEVRFLKLLPSAWRRDLEGGGVPGAWQPVPGLTEDSRLLTATTTTTTPGSPGSLAERCKVGAALGEVPPRPHVAAARGAVPSPGRAGDHAEPAGSATRRSGLCVYLSHLPGPGGLRRARPGPPCPWPGSSGPVSHLRLRLSALALREPAKVGPQVAEGLIPSSALQP